MENEVYAILCDALVRAQQPGIDLTDDQMHTSPLARQQAIRLADRLAADGYVIAKVVSI